MNLGVLDYGAGNLRSVLNAFAAIGHTAKLVACPDDFAEIDVLVFPGQGAFGDSVRILTERQLWQPLQAWLAAGRPYLGICLGYQLLFDSSEESPGVQGLGIVPGMVRKFSATSSGLKIPHMGWNEAHWTPQAQCLLEGLANPCHVYFVHSYYPDVSDPALAACTTQYGVQFTSGIIRRNLVAVQFHPEKSQATGLKLLRNALASFIV
jgi:imidazole glycerol phosphate synthase glutamine amidotransferase subunit